MVSEMLGIIPFFKDEFIKMTNNSNWSDKPVPFILAILGKGPSRHEEGLKFQNILSIVLSWQLAVDSPINQ